MTTSFVQAEWEHGDRTDEGFHERGSSGADGRAGRAMTPVQQLRGGDCADGDRFLAQRFQERLESYRAPLGRNEDRCIEDYSHGVSIAGNASRPAAMSAANASASAGSNRGRVAQRAANSRAETR